MDDDPVRKPSGHEIGMALDALSIDELKDRIALLKAEIDRLDRAVAAKAASRSAADAVFRS